MRDVKSKVRRLALVGVTAIGLAALTGCQSDRANLGQYSSLPASTLLAKSAAAIKKNRLEDASLYLDTLEHTYPFYPETRQGELNLMFVNYNRDKMELVRAAADRFIQLYPGDPDLDYVYYLKGLSYQKQAGVALFRHLEHKFGMKEDTDASHLKQAFRAFSLLVNRYPNSVYAPDAYTRMINIKYALANYELTLAEFYYAQGAYVAAVNRATIVVKSFTELPAAKKALEIMQLSYQRLGLKKQAAQIGKILKQNYRK